ncbi:helix-turn-helix transcriptional regulator [Devosia rhizoryzae]|uniref:Helix-turn-helix domain-containing protein n=1 Tax=Devosia rhizoryzae TaxID=2774137 RepID=A0ABX7C5F7_9HYPH|nr:helix-turn-helix domain-containing protein [Devosia rhizoryzae]QQR39465.1 helix-turn-helix domain-containing protein [Devosia rhizoryzae]
MPQMKFEQLCELFTYTPKGRPLKGFEVAELLGISIRTIEDWRQTGEGPRYYSPTGTRRCWYSERDILEWMAAGAKRSTSEAA